MSTTNPTSSPNGGRASETRVMWLKPESDRRCFDQRPFAVHVVREDEHAWYGRAGRVLELGLAPMTYPKFAWVEVARP